MEEKMQLITHKLENSCLRIQESFVFDDFFSYLRKPRKIMENLASFETIIRNVNDFSLKMRVLVKITIYVFVNKMRNSKAYEVKKPILETIIVAF